jgi:phosphoribosyl 1,2-cyclic phosphodiesterase
MIHHADSSGDIFTCSLQSGSNGNCIYVETPDARLIFDAGISGKVAQQRLACYQRELDQADGLIISHNHSDHVKGAGVFHRKFQVPLYITTGAWKATKNKLGSVREVQHFSPGEILCFGTTRVETIPTAHDGIDGVAFIVAYGDKRLGIFTDLGHPFAGLADHLMELDGLYLESNYDPEMLENSAYPGWLKKRIRGEGGHLSNREASYLVRTCGQKLRFLVLSHLSEHNNSPALALETAQEILASIVPVYLAPRTGVSDAFGI